MLVTLSYCEVHKIKPFKLTEEKKTEYTKQVFDSIRKEPAKFMELDKVVIHGTQWSPVSFDMAKGDANVRFSNEKGMAFEIKTVGGFITISYGVVSKDLKSDERHWVTISEHKKNKRGVVKKVFHPQAPQSEADEVLY